MSIFEKLRLLAEWSPLLSQVQVVLAAEDPHDQAVAVIDALQFAAGKTSFEMDDEALAHLEAILKSEEVQAFFSWVVQQVKEAGA